MLVHGAWHGSWCWEPVRQRLDGAGIATAAVDSPSVATPGSDLHADGDLVYLTAFALDAGESELATSHSPFPSRPDEVARLLAGLASRSRSR